MSARRAVFITSIAFAGVGLVPGGALAHEGHSHQADDAVAYSAADEPRLERLTSRATARDAAAAAAAVRGAEGQAGAWGPVTDWPVVGVHAALLPSGKVLAYDSVGDAPAESYDEHDFTRATVWDPVTGAHTPVNVTTGFNVFCSGLAHLTDGSVFLAGGNLDAELNGLEETHTFEPTTNRWSLGPVMVASRWYPSVTPLSNGEMLITEGGPDMPEVRTTAGRLRALSTASLNLPDYPWIDVAPDGRAFYSGPDQTLRSLDTEGRGAWQTYADRDALDRTYGSRAMFDVGKILVAGGAFSSADSRVIDINGATPQVTQTESMASGRRQHNLTVVADGTVIATGGNSSGESLVDVANGVYPAEQWNPATSQWTTLASMRVTRQYHSTALLLPDGRLLSSGGGICGACVAEGYLAKNAEIFSPPYLFKKDGSGELAPRPDLTYAPARMPYATPFEVATSNPASIGKLALVRLGAVTHSVDMEQRYIPLSFTAGAGILRATSPRDANIAPPGVYMLFAIGADGVPSHSRMVTLDPTAPAPGPAILPGGGRATGAAGAATAGAAAATAGAGAAAAGQRFSVKVVRVIDGDTVRVRLSSGKLRTVRLLGIDAPQGRRRGAPAQCGSRQAASALRSLVMQRRGGNLTGRRVRLATDPRHARADRSGRLLAYLSRGSVDVNRQMVRRGWARVQAIGGRSFRRSSAYRLAQRSAKVSRRGVWRTCGGNFHQR